jgi:hypothetical protein
VTLGIPTTGDDVWSNGFTVAMDTNATVNSLNNTARARTIATPQMTANNAPSPFVAAASSVQDGTQPFQAFDRNYTNTTFWSAGGSINSGGILSIDFGSGGSVVIDGYTIFGSNDQTLNPRNWTFEGSDNNVNWTILQTVSLPSAIGAGSTYSIASIGNATPYRYYRVNGTLNGGGTRYRITELELYQPGTASLAAGGSFNFNTAGVTVSTVGIGQSVAGICTVTNTTGTTALSIANSISAVPSQTTLLHSGAGNFTFTCPNFIVNNTAATSRIVSKSSAGLITMNGNLVMGTGTNSGSVNIVLDSTNGNTIINGNVTGFQGTAGGGATSLITVRQTAGNLTINGNITPTNIAGISTGYNTILFQGTTLTLNGIVNGNNTSSVISTGTVNVNGTINGSLCIYANATITINITGDTYSGLAPAVNCSAFPSSIVNLTGNMYNNLGRMAIWCPNIFISNSATTLWRMDTGGGNYKFLYSADSFPNLPSTSDVRRLVSYGPASGLTGTMWVASPSDTRIGVLTDNTVGTADITATDILNFINTSSDPLAVRMRTMLTDNSAGQLISEYNFV